MIIKILGSGCPNCRRLEKNAREAVAGLSMDNVSIEKITDFTEIARYGAMAMPALVIDEELKIAGRIPDIEEIRSLLKND